MFINLINIFTESILFFILWLVIISILLILFRVSFSWKLFKIFFWLIMINSTTHFLSSTNPEQNSILLLVIVSFFYLFLFFIIKLIKKGTTKIWKFKLYQVFSIFILLLFLFWKWEFLEVKNESISPELAIWTNGEIFYKWMIWTKSNLGFFNLYWEKVYDTIKYDIDLDGFVDFKTVDNNDDWIIDETIIYTYYLQKILLILILFWSIVLVYIFSNWKNNFNLKKKNKEVFKTSKDIDTSAIKINDDNILKSKKILAFVLLLSLLLSNISIVDAKRYEEMTNYEREQTMEYKRWIQIAEYFKKIKNCNVPDCDWISSPMNNFLSDFRYNPKHITIWGYIYWLFDDSIDNYIKQCGSWWYSTYSCGKNNEAITKIDELIESYIDSINYKLSKNPNYTFINDSFLVGIILYWDNKKNPSHYDFLPDYEDSEGTPGNNEENIIIESEWNYIIDNNELNTNSEENNNEDEINKPKIDDSNIIETWELTDDEIDNLIIDTAKDYKALADIAWWWLKWINYILWDEIIKDIDDIKKTKWDISKKIKDTFWKKWTDSVDKLKDISDNVDKIKDNKPDKVKKYNDWVSSKWWGLWKTIDTIGKIGGVLDIYWDYKDFQEKSWWDWTKTFIWTVTTTLLKEIVWANPVDVTIGIIWWWLHLLWYEEAAEKLEEYSLWDRSKQLVQDAILSETDETIWAMDQTLDDFLDTYNDPNSSIFDKSSSFIVSTTVFWYWTLVFWANQVLWWAESVINSIIE